MGRKDILIAIIVLTAIIILFIIAMNPNTRYNNLCVNQTEWDNIINTRQENKNFVLEDIEFNNYNLIIDENNSKLYYSLINNNKTKYNPNVNFSSKEDNVKIAILSDEITDEKIQSNYELKIMIYNSSEYRIYNLVCTNLPMLNISYKEQNTKKHKNIPMELYLFNNLSNSPNRIIKSLGKFKMNENNYIFFLDVMTPGNNIRENKISILNMKPSSKYILTQISQDTNQERMGHPVELFINNEYKGIYYLEFMMEKEPIWEMVWRDCMF